MDAIARPQSVMLKHGMIERQSKWLYDRLLGKKFVLVVTVEGRPVESQIFEDQQIDPNDTIGVYQLQTRSDTLKFFLPVTKPLRPRGYLTFPLSNESKPMLTVYREKIVYSFISEGRVVHWIIFVKG